MFYVCFVTSSWTHVKFQSDQQQRVVKCNIDGRLPGWIWCFPTWSAKCFFYIFVHTFHLALPNFFNYDAISINWSQEKLLLNFYCLFISLAQASSIVYLLILNWERLQKISAHRCASPQPLLHIVALEPGRYCVKWWNNAPYNHAKQKKTERIKKRINKNQEKSRTARRDAAV